MRYATVDLLACPLCKHYPLKLKVFKEVKISSGQPSIKRLKPFCKTYCALLNMFIFEFKTNTGCEECLTRDIVWGVLTCPHCGGFYPIVLGVPIMYPHYLKKNIYVKVLYRFFTNRYGLIS